MQQARRPTVAVVVDDDDAVRDSLRVLLETAGFHVATFESASEFLTGAVVQDLACVLIDHHMPNMTGLELLEKLRQGSPVLPVALMTGSPSPELSRRAFEIGVTEMLEKPLQEDLLLAFVAQSFEN